MNDAHYFQADTWISYFKINKPITLRRATAAKLWTLRRFLRTQPYYNVINVRSIHIAYSDPYKLVVEAWAFKDVYDQRFREQLMTTKLQHPFVHLIEPKLPLLAYADNTTS